MQGEQANEGAGSGDADRMTELKGKVDTLGRLFIQLEDVRTASRRTRMGVIIVILLVLLGYGLYIYSAVKSLYKRDLPQVQAKLMESVGRLATTAMDQLAVTAKKVAPVYRDELQKQLKNRGPEIKEKFVSEAELLLNNIKEKGLATVEERLTEMANRQQERVKAAFPVLKDDEAIDTVIENLDIALRGAAYDVLKSRVAKGEERLRAINEKILAFLPEENRDQFEARLRKAWDTFLMYEVPKMVEGK